MKYLKYQQEYKLENLKSDFKSSEIVSISEEFAFENDITWGGSLLGRLINSTIRKLKVGYNFTKINNVVKQVKDELLELLKDHKLSDDQKTKANQLISRMLLTEIYNEVISKKELEEKLNSLLGTNSEDGKIDKAINEITKVDIEGKDELLDKLKKFKDDLSKLRDEPKGESEKEDSSEESNSKSDPAVIFYQNSKSLLQSVAKLHLDIKNNTVKFQQGDEKVSTFFDEKKYQQQRSNTIEEINKKLEMAKKAVSIYTTKNNKERVNFYTGEIKNYEKKLERLKGSEVKKAESGSTSSTERKEDFDVDADKRAKEQTAKLHNQNPVKVGESYDYILEEIDANLQGQESHAKAAWTKVTEAYRTSGISKYIPYIESLLNPKLENIKESKKRIGEIGKQVVVNYGNVGKPILFKASSEEEKKKSLISESIQEGPSINDVAKSISLFGKVILAFNEDMGLLGSYGASYKKEGGDAGGAGNHLKLFISSFNEMKEVYPKLKKPEAPQAKTEIKKESLLNYSNFIMVREADEVQTNEEPQAQPEQKAGTQPEQKYPTEVDIKNKVEEVSDSVKTSWFKFFKQGEEKKWVVTEEDKKLRDEVESKKDESITLNDPSNDDHIIKIVNLFGRAYKLYATMVIPSGRPGGRISQKTLREYEYIGKSESPNINHSENGIIPGNGPWAAKSVYDKWQDGITKILEDKQLRKILANTKFVSEAESSTDTAIGGKGSGKTLLSFINDMLRNDGEFKKHREEIFKKYFGVEATDPKYLQGERSKSEDFAISEEDKGEIDTPVFTPNGRSTIGKDQLSIFKDRGVMVKTNEKIYTLIPYNVILQKGSKSAAAVLFKYQVNKQSMITDAVKLKKLKTNKLEESVPYSKEPVYIGFAKIPNIYDFRVGRKFKFKSISMKDAKDQKFEFSDVEIDIKGIEYLIIPTLTKDGKKQVAKEVVLGGKGSIPDEYLLPNKIADLLKEKFQK